jgi:hypothetical protein
MQPSSVAGLYFSKGDVTPRDGDIMLRTIKAANVSLVILLILAARAHAANSTQLHPEPWPIRHWHNHQPRRSDLAPEQSWKIDRLYLKIERKDPKLIAPDFRPN